MKKKSKSSKSKQTPANPHASPPTTIIIIAISSLLWYLIGCATFFADLTISPEMVSQLPADQQMLRKFMPAWMPVIYGVEVFSGTIGCIGLILKKKWAVQLLLISFIGVLMRMGYTLLFTQAVTVFGPSSAIYSVMIIFLSGFLYFYSRMAAGRGWLN